MALKWCSYVGGSLYRLHVPNAFGGRTGFFLYLLVSCFLRVCGHHLGRQSAGDGVEGWSQMWSRTSCLLRVNVMVRSGVRLKLTPFPLSICFSLSLSPGPLPQRAVLKHVGPVRRQVRCTACVGICCFTQMQPRVWIPFVSYRRSLPPASAPPPLL